MGIVRASIDGREVAPQDAVVPVDDEGFTTGWTVFETARVIGGGVPRLAAHLARLRASAASACVPCPLSDVLEAEVRALIEGGPALARLRITLSGSGRRALTLSPLDPSRRGSPVRAVRGPHHDEPFLGGAVKHGSRAGWRAAVARSGVDEVLLVDGSGRFTEATTAAVVAVVDGALWTAPDDGRILASTTVEAILEDAAALGIDVRREGPPAAGPWDGLYVASATRWLSPVVSLDGVALPGWEPVGRDLLAVDASRTCGGAS